MDDFSDFYECFKGLNEIENINVSKLFHYTSNEKKASIVNKNGVILWFTRADKFLDKNEGIQILEPYYYACGALYDEKKIDEKFYFLLKSIKSKDLNKHIKNSWVICFCSSGSSKFAKIRYAPNDGWILGFDALDVREFCNEFDSEFDMFSLKNVCYGREEFQKYFCETLLCVYQRYREIAPLNNDLKLAEFDKKIKRFLIRSIAEYALVYKGADYRDEEEIRLIYTIKKQFQKWENEAKTCTICMSKKVTVNGKEEPQHLEIRFCRDSLIFQSQKTEICFDTKINKPIVTANEIREVLSKE